jgi:hypothetical protein
VEAPSFTDEGEGVAADRRRRRLDHGRSRGHRDGCVNGVSTVAKDVETDARRQRLARRDDSVRRQDGLIPSRPYELTEVQLHEAVCGI